MRARSESRLLCDRRVMPATAYGTPPGLQTFSQAESARGSRATAYMAKTSPLPAIDPYGLKRIERSRATTPAGYKNLANEIFREHIGIPLNPSGTTKEEQRAEKSH
jgi:hypothetical protein